MNLLLLLSAMMTALTGVAGGPRPVEVAARHQVLSAAVERAALAATPRASGHIHLLGDFGASALFALAGGTLIAMTAPPRLYLDRPRA
jgi:hypothetical protein